MLLVIDSGNTNTCFAIFNNNQLVGQWKISTNSKRTADEYLMHISHFLSTLNINKNKISDTIISNVVPQTNFALKKLCNQHLKCSPLIIGESNLDIGLDIKTDKPTETGADRLVNSLAAFNKYGDNVIIIDFGTATNFDVTGTNGTYLGGIIAPGINLSIQALHKAAAKLPEIDVQKPSKIIGTSTVLAMQSGIYWGYISLIEGLINRITNERNTTMKTIATGGLAPLFFDAVDTIEFLEPDLTIHGLKLIYETNKKENYDIKLKKA